MRLGEINRQVNEAREGQGTKNQENRPVTSEVREKDGNASGSQVKGSTFKRREQSMIKNVTNRSCKMRSDLAT